MKFHEDHYSANLMSVVLVGRHSLDALEQLAVTSFSDVVDRNRTLQDFSSEVDSLYDQTGLLVKVVPNK